MTIAKAIAALDATRAQLSRITYARLAQGFAAHPKLAEALCWRTNPEQRCPAHKLMQRASELCQQTWDLTETEINNVEPSLDALSITYAVDNERGGYYHAHLRVPVVSMTDPRLFDVWAEGCVSKHESDAKARAHELCRQRRRILNDIADLPEELRDIALGKKPRAKKVPGIAKS